MVISRLKHLAMVLENVKPHPNPSLDLEQYSLCGEDAARILWFAGRIHDDINDKIVLDLGCGTGILSIGSILLGAKFVFGVDIDSKALEVALDNAKNLNVYSRVSFLCAEVSKLPMIRIVDTVIQNPPFGVHKRGADIMFLEASMKIARVVYSLHKYTVENNLFISRVVSKLGGRIVGMLPLTITIPHIFDFHREFKRKVNVILYRIVHV
ncbi:MAG: METTL5 family protein [Candidatus Methanomethylicia archaeon]